jgi:hypothetical protein
MILIYTEDEKGREPVKILAKKITPNVKVKVEWSSKGNLISNSRKTAAQINQHISNNPDISKIIVCVDTECTQCTEEQIHNAGNEVSVLVSKPVKYCPVVHALESWLASDPKPIETRLGNKKFSLPQTECNPKEYIKQKWSDFDYIKHNTILAEEVNIDTIAKNNTSFKEFIQTIKST